MMLSGGGIKIALRDFQPVHDKCTKGIKEEDRCSNVYDDKELGYLRCRAYVNPSYWWDHVGTCPLASHTYEISEREEARLAQVQRTRVGQQKQKKWRR